MCQIVGFILHFTIIFHWHIDKKDFSWTTVIVDTIQYRTVELILAEYVFKL